MKTIVKMLFDGDISVFENLYPKGKEYREVNRQIHDEFDYFENKLPKEDFKRLEDLRGLFCDSGNVELQAAIGYGMKLGIMLMIEACSGMNEIVRDDR